MKKGKLNNNGFVLVETLIVTVFVMTIFAVLYNNFTPIMGEYEKREFYDDIDGKYAAYWFKILIEKDDYSIPTTVGSSPWYTEFQCGNLVDGVKQNLCNELSGRLGVQKIYITQYNLSNFKNNTLTSSGSFSGGIHRYVGYLPDFTLESLNDAKYRVIVEFERSDGAGGNYMAYSTFEVIK